MCHASCLVFGAKNLLPTEVRNKKVLEIGSLIVPENRVSGLRPIIESMKPESYVGVDIAEGEGVTVICRAEAIAERFGKESFDLIVATELIEHTVNWPDVVSNIKNVCSPGGIILITTRSEGFAKHNYPEDYWRYSIADIRAIFQDCKILFIEADYQYDGVFAKIRKPTLFKELSRESYRRTALYSVVLKRKVVPEILL